MAFIPSSAGSLYTPYKHVVLGTNDMSKDGPKFQAAIDSAVADGGGTVWFDGDLALESKNYDMTGGSAEGSGMPVSLCGLDRATARLISPGGACKLTWGGLGDFAQTVAFTAMDPATTGWNEFTSAGLSAVAQDFLLFKSDDMIPDVLWHSGTWEPRSMEMHQLMYKEGANWINDFGFADIYATAPLVAKIPMLGPVTIANFTAVGVGVSADKYGIQLTQCHGAKLENVIFQDSPFPILFKYCANVQQSGVIINNMLAWGDGSGYGSIFACCTNAMVNDCQGYGTRHFVSTGASSQPTGVIRQGTTLKLKVDNNNLVAIGTDDTGSGSLIMLDTHVESYGAEFTNNQIDCGSESGNVNIGISTRGRFTVVKGNTIRGGPNARGVAFYGPDGVSQGNTFIGLWTGTRVLQANQATNKGNPSRARISGNVYQSLGGEGVLIETGADHTIGFEDFRETGTKGADAQAMTLDTAATVTVTNCNFHRQPGGSRASINFEAQANATNRYQLRGNTMTGYGNDPADRLGLKGTNAAAIETENQPYNRSDP